MKKLRITRSLGVLMIVATLAACTGGPSVGSDLTIDQAKAATQKMEREIAAIVPKDLVVKVEQDATGTLDSCGAGRGNVWVGLSHVTLKPEVEVDATLRLIEEHYRGSRFSIRTRHDSGGYFEVQLIAADGVENYLIGHGINNPDHSIDISSNSGCFNLPKGEYPPTY